MKKTLLSLSFIVYSLSFTCAQTINTVVGNGTGAFAGDGGQATSSEIYYPSGVAMDSHGNLYISDNFNNRIRKVSTSGIITTYGGNGTAGFNADGIAATNSELNYPVQIAMDKNDNLYIADRYNQRVRVINTSGIISTVAGNGTASFGGDGGQATNASMNYIAGVAIDGNGNIFISDYNNDRVRKVNTSGVINTYAGTGTFGYSGDGGQATAAEINYPGGLVTDAAGNLYMTDASNARVRVINTSGVISTIAGNGVASSAGDGGQATAAELNDPSSVTIDRWGNIYIDEYLGNHIRMVKANGIISTIAGTGTASFSGDGGAATAADIFKPTGLVLDGNGNLYFGDEFNNRIRILTGGTLGINENESAAAQLRVYPNPASDKLFVQMNGISGKSEISIYNMLGQNIISSKIEAKPLVEISVADVQTGLYIVKVQTENGGVLVKKIEIER